MAQKNQAGVLVTGNLGYIGTMMTKALKKAFYTVIGLDTDFFRESDFFPIDFESKPDKQLIKDIRHVNANDLNGVDAVIHLAALSNDPLGGLQPKLTDEINHKATLRLAILCKELNIQRFIFASSCSLYGIAQHEGFLREDDPLNPQTAYAKSKVASEEGLKRLASSDFHPIFLRNATVYGLSPRLRLDLVVNQLVAMAFLTGEIVVKSDGTPWRPLIHIEDFCGAFLAALNAPLEKIGGSTLNVGVNSENYQVKDIAAEIQKQLPATTLKVLNENDKDERTYRVDFTKIQQLLKDFRPRWNLQKGIVQLIQAYQKYDLTMDVFKSDHFFRTKKIQSLIRNKKLDSHYFWMTSDD